MASRTTTTATKGGGPDGSYAQRGHTITTVRETEKITKRNRTGDPIVKTKTRTVYYLDGKKVNLNWWDRFRLGFMGIHGKQKFLAKKLAKQERKGQAGSRK